jgi:hypothetical protein
MIKFEQQTNEDVQMTILKKSAKYDILVSVMLKTAGLNYDKNSINIYSQALDTIFQIMEPEKCNQKLKQLQDEKLEQLKKLEDQKNKEANVTEKP